MNFNAYHVSATESKSVPYTRRDFYKISFVTEGAGRLQYADHVVDIDQPYLLFFNPVVPYAWEARSATYSSCNCAFTEEFLVGAEQRGSLSRSQLFRIGGTSAFAVSPAWAAELQFLFDKLLADFHSTYDHKADLLRTYVNLLLHEALKQLPATPASAHTAGERITTDFLELLERQFPIDSPQAVLRLKSASDFAGQLAVHVNYLNQVVRAATGKTTTRLIQEKVVQEAILLLTHTDWPVADIAYSLGFEYPTYFNNFFKRHTQRTPLAYRSAAVAAAIV